MEIKINIETLIGIILLICSIIYEAFYQFTKIDPISILIGISLAVITFSILNKNKKMKNNDK